MRMNNKAQIFFSIIIAGFYLMSAILLWGYVRDDVTTANTALNCSLDTLSAGNKLLCLVTDASAIYLFIVITTIGLVFVTERFVR